MSKFEFCPTEIPDLVLIKPFFVSDQRGYLTKSFEKSLYEKNGIFIDVHEELRSCSTKGTLRGLHFQREHSQDKIVQVEKGKVFDVVVDLRPESETFGRWQGFCLSAENRNMLYIPKRFAHGFLVLSEQAEMHYLCGDIYDQKSETGILWNDISLSIEWPLEPEQEPLLSPRDLSFPTFSEFCEMIRSK
jgi:dTDP-4-dehydrorhamnose 3,5-epimerase